MTHRDPYDVLEVHPSADLREVKKAYRRLARQHHPDAQGETGTADRFIEIRRAYEAIVKQRGGRPETAEPNAETATGTAEESTGFEYDVDFGEEEERTGHTADHEPNDEPMGEPTWRDHLRDTGDWLIAELWSLILIAVTVLPMVGIVVLCRWYLGMRWLLFLVTAWLLVLAILRPDRWQRD